MTNSGLPTATSKRPLCVPKPDTRHFSGELMPTYTMRHRRNGRHSFNAFSSKSRRAKDNISGCGTGNVDVTDENEFQLSRYDGNYTVITVPTDQLIPVIDIKTSTRLRLVPNKFIASPSGWFEKTLSALSTESYVKIEEKSSDPQTSQIYLLHLSHFLDPSTTILGSQLIQQDLFLFENRPDFSFRFRFLQQDGAGQYSTGMSKAILVNGRSGFAGNLFQKFKSNRLCKQRE